MNHITADLMNSETFPIAIIVSLFNRDITQALQNGALQRLAEKGFKPEQITIVEVPGAFEIPLIAKRLAKAQNHEVIVALGAVIRGETTHYDYVCQQVSAGCQRVSLDFDIPVIFGVLTTENDAQAWARSGGEHGHKGIDAVDSACFMRSVLTKL